MTLGVGDPLTGPRAESWRVEMLALDGTPLGPLDGAASLSLTWDASRDILGTGSLQWAGLSAPDWKSIRLQPFYEAVFPDGTEAEWPLGVFIPDIPAAHWTDGSQEQTVGLFDGLKVLVDDKTPTTYALPKGTYPTVAVRSILSAAGIPDSAVSLVDSVVQLQVAMVWEPGTTRLRIVNDLLLAANYWPLATDGYGVYTSSPYALPTDRADRYLFEDGEASIYEPEFEVEADTFDIPNRVTIIGRTSGETPPLVAVVTNEDLMSPYSQPNRGRWIDRTPETVEAVDFPTLDALARRRLAEATQVANAVSLSHWLVPLDLHDLVTFVNSPAGVGLRGSVQARAVSLTEDGLAAATAHLQEVTS
jgi:hypothetical protein